MNALRDAACYFGLQRQDILRIALIFLGPEMLVRGRLNELRGDANLAAGAEDGAFHDAIHSEFASDLRNRFVHSAITKNGSSGDYVQGTDLGEIRDELVGHTIREELFVRIIGKIF